MATLPAGNTYPVQPTTSYPNTPLSIFQSLGTLEGTIFNRSGGGLSFVLHQAVKEFVLEHIDLTHDGVAAAYGDVVKFDLYKVPANVSIQNAIYAGSTYHIGTQQSLPYNGGASGRVNYSMDGEDMAGRRFARGDRLVAVLASVGDSATVSYYSTKLINACISGLGRYGTV